jgi:hypothetical protein
VLSGRAKKAIPSDDGAAAAISLDGNDVWRIDGNGFAVTLPRFGYEHIKVLYERERS